MNKLSFKHWLFKEMADYGFGEFSSEILGGTDIMKGDDIFHHIDASLIINELIRMPKIGAIEAVKIWEDSIQYGNEPGALKVSITPLGSMRLMTRQLISDIEGNPTWICRNVCPISDFRDQYKEMEIADSTHKTLNEISKKPISSPDNNYEDIERLSWKLWNETKKNHPSYIMFPTTLRKQDENYYKLVYEFRGQGVGAPYNGKTGRAEQFDIDLIYYPKKGLIRCFGYDIDSSTRERKFYVQPPEWDEMFSPKQDEDEIVENIIKLFLQY